MEYNPRIHGPYDPSRFYGKRKFIFKQVHLTVNTARSRHVGPQLNSSHLFPYDDLKVVVSLKHDGTDKTHRTRFSLTEVTTGTTDTADRN